MAELITVSKLIRERDRLNTWLENLGPEVDRTKAKVKELDRMIAIYGDGFEPVEKEENFFCKVRGCQGPSHGTGFATELGLIRHQQRIHGKVTHKREIV